MEKQLTIDEFISCCGERKKKIRITKEDKERVEKCRATLEALQAEGKVYGTNTGVGPFFHEPISQDNPAEFQRRLLLSHATGVGPYLSIEESRGMMFLLINMLRKGYSGISLSTLEFLVELYNRDIIPAIPSQGSLGASGDLAPLAHLALVLVGEGMVFAKNGSGVVPTKESAWFRQGIVSPVELKRGEGLALINGTHMMTALLARAVYSAEILVKTADVIAALTLTALQGNPEAFSEEIHLLRPHPGQLASAANIRRLLADNEKSSAPANLQDGYSLRCIAQVHGPIKETVWFVKNVVERELNSVSGNPLFMDSGVLHGGNFHGHPLALAADYLSIALTTLSGISERRIERILNPAFSNGLPPFLTKESEKGDYGLMIAHYTAASLVSENKTLAHPASVDSIPTAAGQEDYVSMGALAARKAKQILTNTQIVLTTELVAAARALGLRNALPSQGMLPIFEFIAASFTEQRSAKEVIGFALPFVCVGPILRQAEKAVGTLE